MLFELHDIWLHRRWLRARDKRRLYAETNCNPDVMFTRQMVTDYTRLSKAEAHARQAYMDHQRPVKRVSSVTKLLVIVDDCRSGDDLWDMFLTWTTKVRL